MLSMQPIGYVRSPYRDTHEIPKGLGAKHEAEGVLEIRAEFELGLTDIEGFSHLFVIWAFDRSEGFNLVGTPPGTNPIRTFIGGSQTEAIGQFGGGLEIRLTRHLGLINDFSWNVVDGRDNNFGMARTGINLAF